MEKRAVTAWWWWGKEMGGGGGGGGFGSDCGLRQLTGL